MLTFPLNLDSRWELHPGSLVDLQGAVACPQPPLLELDPEEAEECQSVHTRGPSNPAGAAALCSHLAAHTRGSPIWRKYGANRILQYSLAGLPCPKTVWR